MIRDAETQLTSLEKAEIAVSSLKSAGDEVCALGDGNSRIVELGWEIELDCSGDVLKASVGEQGAVASLEHCDVSCYGSGDKFGVGNVYGRVEIDSAS